MKYTSLKQFLEHRTPPREEPEAQALLKRLRAARKRGYLTRSEFIAACEWKSIRPRKRYSAHTTAEVREATGRALRGRSERRRLEALIALDGVGVAMASAVLALTDPEKYAVIDVRVWRMLYALGAVKSLPQGIGFRFKHWYRYLMILRAHAKRLGWTTRAVELALFRHHRRYYRIASP